MIRRRGGTSRGLALGLLVCGATLVTGTATALETPIGCVPEAVDPDRLAALVARERPDIGLRLDACGADAATLRLPDGGSVRIVIDDVAAAARTRVFASAIVEALATAAPPRARRADDDAEAPPPPATASPSTLVARVVRAHPPPRRAAELLLGQAWVPSTGARLALVRMAYVTTFARLELRYAFGPLIGHLTFPSTVRPADGVDFHLPSLGLAGRYPHRLGARHTLALEAGATLGLAFTPPSDGDARSYGARARYATAGVELRGVHRVTLAHTTWSFALELATLRARRARREDAERPAPFAPLGAATLAVLVGVSSREPQRVAR